MYMRRFHTLISMFVPMLSDFIYSSQCDGNLVIRHIRLNILRWPGAGKKKAVKQWILTFMFVFLPIYWYTTVVFFSKRTQRIPVCAVRRQSDEPGSAACRLRDESAKTRLLPLTCANRRQQRARHLPSPEPSENRERKRRRSQRLTLH